MVSALLSPDRAIWVRALAGDIVVFFGKALYSHDASLIALNFRKFKVALNPLDRIFLELCKMLHLIMLITIR